MKLQRHLVPLPEDQQDRLRDALHDRGEEDVAEALGVSRIALLRGAAGLGVMRGTRALIARGLDELDDDDERADEDNGEDEDEDQDNVDGDEADEI